MADTYAPKAGEAEKIAAMTPQERAAYLVKHALDPMTLSGADRRYGKKVD